MKKKALLIGLIMLIINSVTAQHTERFKEITYIFKPSDTILVNTKHKNGNKKEFGFYYTYLTNKYQYTVAAGKHIRYHYSGGIAEEMYYDNFGILLKSKFYDSFGNLMEETKAISIDTNEKDLDAFLSYNKSYDIIVHEKKYQFSPEICGWFLFKEGKRMNGKKIDKWIKYYPNGDIKKVRDF
ncbi:hypothetical protein [Tenacibaculum sp. 190524A05c]|uniref:hypothetical protein n=1 Tax=Tenacibaculum platacis TaxID=3137852 RepID=UPI0032B1CC3E